MKKLILFLAVMVAAFTSALSQIVTTAPALLQESSKNVTLTFHADRSGVPGLTGLSSSTPLYCHIGVLTNKSNGSWDHVVTDWNTSNDANRLTYVAPDTYSFTIGDIRSFFKLTDESEKVTKIAFIVRTATPSASVAQTEDIFIDVLEPGFRISLMSDARSSVISEPTDITFTVNSTDAANLSLSVDGKTVASLADAMQLTATHRFTDKGFYEVKATATNGGNTLTETLTVAYPSPSEQKNYPGGIPRQGAVKNNDGTVTFCLAAPMKSSVILVPSWNDYQVLDHNVMNYQDYNGNRYFLTTVSGLDNSTWYPYYYLVDGTLRVGDPYANLVLDGYSDKWLPGDVFADRPAYPYDKFNDVQLAVYRGDMNDYKFSEFKIPNHKNLIIYEMLFRDFTGTDKTADGTIRAAIEKIPYLRSLGVNCVELMPVMEFNGNNSWGYNTNFYMALDKAYGSPNDLRDFVELCHQSGIAVILDIVFNQSDGLHPWYQMYPISENPFYNATAPHDYSVLNDWNQSNELVKSQWDDALRYWMTAYNVDGFRFDLVKGLGDNDSYGSGTEAYNASRVANMKRYHQVIRSVKPDGIHINENLAGTREENEMAADGQLNWSNVNGDAASFARAAATSNLMDGFYASNWGRTDFSTVSYAESHDEERISYVATQQAALRAQIPMRMRRLGSVAATMLMTPGPKMIWQFGELGADETTKTGGNNNTDPKIVCWPMLDDQYRKALHDNYSELCGIRRSNPAIFESETTTYSRTGFTTSLSSVRTIRLVNGNDEIVVLINPSLAGQAKTVSSSVSAITASNVKILSKSEGVSDAAMPSVSNGSVSFAVPSNSYVVLGSGSVAGIDNISGDETPAKVYGGIGEIVIAGDYDMVSVHDISGMAIDTLNVPAGIYIVNVDGNVTKVVVR